MRISRRNLAQVENRKLEKSGSSRREQQKWKRKLRNLIRWKREVRHSGATTEIHAAKKNVLPNSIARAMFFSHRDAPLILMCRRPVEERKVERRDNTRQGTRMNGRRRDEIKWEQKFWKRQSTRNRCNESGNRLDQLHILICFGFFKSISTQVITNLCFF